MGKSSQEPLTIINKNLYDEHCDRDLFTEIDRRPSQHTLFTQYNNFIESDVYLPTYLSVRRIVLTIWRIPEWYQNACRPILDRQAKNDTSHSEPGSETRWQRRLSISHLIIVPNKILLPTKHHHWTSLKCQMASMKWICFRVLKFVQIVYTKTNEYVTIIYSIIS